MSDNKQKADAPKPVPSKKRAFRFMAKLDFWELTCWREIIVPSDYTFLDFHFVLQAAFNWLGYHLFDFRLKSNGEVLKITETDTGAIDSIWADIFGSDRSEEVAASEILLSDIFPRTRTAVYSYDYGDSWEVKIKLLETIKDAALSEPTCLQGSGDAPPEDVGGEGGFINFLEIINDQTNPDHQETVEWGEEQLFERFDLDRVNQKLSEWRLIETLI
ncbi:MAG: plasmid pRiA4b ORF-3 family protein [Coriobacteriia bacterium]|nr:plasmid pRiA4b ORF-3 family protein [Coriobacteriia bacterium]